MAEALTLGELLIDFVPTISGVSLAQAPMFKKAPGGAPANVAVGLARLGTSSGFLGKVGDDAFGHYLGNVLAQESVDTSGLRYTSEAHTMLAFVSVKEDGERDFMFYRHPSADMLYAPQDVAVEKIRIARLLHFGSISMINEPSRTATRHALQVAKDAGLLISYDPNLRLNLWPDEASARETILSVWNEAAIIKISEEEAGFLGGGTDLADFIRDLWHPNLELVVVTRGADGCIYFTPDGRGEVAGFAVKVIDTTGAGDGFVAGLLHGILSNPEDWRMAGRITEICRFANAVGALTTTKRGAIPALPRREAVLALLSRG